MEKQLVHHTSRSPSPSQKVINKKYTRISSNHHFSRAERFKPLKRTATPEYMTPISTLSKRTCTFGVGSRIELKNKSGRDSPSPVTYTLPSCFDKEKGGPIMIRTNVLRRMPKEDVPGPGTYNPLSPIGKDSLKFTMRGKIIKEIRTDTPPPNTYNPCFTLVSKSNFKNITFGIGDRMKFKKNNSPGPGTYELPSIFAQLTERASTYKENLKSINKK